MRPPPEAKLVDSALQKWNRDGPQQQTAPTRRNLKMEPSEKRPKERPGSGDRFLANLAYLVPGYQGYKEPTMRQDEDARLRTRILDNLGELTERLTERAAVLERLSLTAAGEHLEQRLKRLARIEKAVRFSPLGFTQFFERESIPESCIEKILETDLMLFHEFDEAMEHVRGTPFPPSSKRGFLRFFTSLDAAIDRIERGLVSRDRVLASC